MSAEQKREYFSRIAPVWDQLPAPPGAPAKVRRFVEKAAARAACRVLDVGCGTGILLPSLLRVLPGAECIVEIDFAESMLRHNGEKFADPRVHRVCADAARAPFRLETFDLVLCFGILPHLEDQPGALAGFLRLLRPGGILCVGHLMSSGELNAFHGSLDAPVSRDRLPLAGELASLLSAMGADVIEVEEEPGWYFLRAEKRGR